MDDIIVRLATREAYYTLVVVIAVATGIGMTVLWPRGDAPEIEFLEGTPAMETFSAEILAVTQYPCEFSRDGLCREAELKIEDGPEEGRTIEVDASFRAGSEDYSEGDGVRVVEVPPGPDASAEAEGSFSIVDFERKPPLLWLAIAFGLLVVLFGRLRGAMSLLGLGISLAIVLAFVVPAILRDSSPVAVALVGAMAVMLTTIPLAHGLGPKSLAAIAGTAFSLLIVVGLAVLLAHATHLTGLASEDAATLAANNDEISFQGLFIAGVVIASLGVLDDVTISQSSTVMALRAANVELGFGQLFARSIAVGRDHVSATVNTLVLAYVGSSLTTLLVFASGDVGFLAAVNLEIVAGVIVATLAGSIGLIAAVPITTALAALLAEDFEPEDLASPHGADPHSH